MLIHGCEFWCCCDLWCGCVLGVFGVAYSRVLLLPFWVWVLVGVLFCWLELVEAIIGYFCWLVGWFCWIAVCTV